jgi:hypothetical protein
MGSGAKRRTMGVRSDECIRDGGPAHIMKMKEGEHHKKHQTQGRNQQDLNPQALNRDLSHQALPQELNPQAAKDLSRLNKEILQVCLINI